MSLTRVASVAALAGALSLAAAGCGGSQVDPDQGALGSTVNPTPTSTAPAPTPAPTAAVTSAMPKPTPTRTPKATASGGDGDAQDQKAPSTAGGGVCSHLGAGQVGAVLGVTVTGAAVPGQTGCKFDQGGKTGMSVTVLDKSTSEAGGMAGAKTEANSAVEGDPQDVPGIGSAAFVITGSMFGGPDVNAAGAVQVGTRIVSVYLVQRSRLDEAKVRTLEVNLLKLVAQARASQTKS
ncbi:hypothetical protein [Nocardioides pocheonensis]|nr:hypothetical protein [Nocardioides pocheonensis]